MNYSLEKAREFSWSSVSGNLNSERVQLLRYLVGSKILDAGCGGGAYVEFLAHQNLDVIGIDKFDEFLDFANRNQKLGTYVKSDITNLPFPDKAFDSAYCFDVLEHVNDIAAIQELARVTSKRLILAVPKEDEIMNQFGLTFLHYQDKTHLRNYTTSSLEALISTINCSHFIIIPELAVPFRALAVEMINIQDKSQPSTNLGSIKDILQKSYNFVVGKLIQKAKFRQVHTGLVAIIDLD